MSYSMGPRIVTDGLIMHADIGNTKSYDNSVGGPIVDLSGNGNNLTITGAPSYSAGKFTLNGSTQGFTRTSAMNNIGTANTVVIIYKTTDVQELWVRGNQNGGYYLSASNNNNYYHGTCGSPSNYVDLNSVTNPYTAGYKDNKYHMWEAKNVDFSSWTYYEWFLYPGGWELAGDVAMIMVYNRPLTATESQQNYNSLKGRFVLT